MKESLSLDTTQRLQQRLLPQQVQFVRMLEMNGAEIEEAVRREVDENPALEIVDEGEPGIAGDDFAETSEELQLADYASDDDVPWYRLEARNHSADDVRYEPQAVTHQQTLLESLSDQADELDLSDGDRRIAAYIIGNIDDNGYLTRSLYELTSDLVVEGVLDGSAADDERVRRLWQQVRGFDPAGVGAIDLRDSLLLQLRRKPRTVATERAMTIVDHYFDLLSKKHFERLQGALSLSDEDMRRALDEIRRLNPKPGSVVGSDVDADDRLRQIVPEFGVDVDGDKISVSLLDAAPDLRVEPSFTVEATATATADKRGRQQAANAFIRQKRDDALVFIHTLEMRRQTLSAVMRAIVTLQRDFFVSGDALRLKPMVLKDVAAVTGLDQSVISRATASKYVMTPYGTFSLKFFFNERTKDSTPEATSHAIEAAIKGVIDEEDHRHPLSDDAIAAALNARGFDLARRTVAKYRERMKIPVARLRRGL